MILSNITNMKRCFDSYVKTNLSGVSIDFEGLPFDNLAVSEWIQPRIIDGYDNRSYRDSEVKQSATILYQINVFVKKSGATTTDRVYAIRDMIDTCFKIGKDIVYTSSSGSTLAIARVRELKNDFPIGDDNELSQYILAWEIDFNEV